MIIIFNDTAPRSRTIGAYRIASALRKQGLQVEVIDHLSKWSVEKLINLLDSIEIEWVGFSLPFVFQLGRVTKLSIDDEGRLINYFRNKKIPVVLGGPTADMIKDSVENFYISIGYSDTSVIAIHKHITESKNLFYQLKNNNKIIYSDFDYKDIDLGDIDIVIKESDLYTEVETLPIEISRGCIFKCAFCNFPHLGKKPGTYIRPKESIKQDIVNFQSNFNINSFMFVDDTFNDSLEKMYMIRDIQQEVETPFTFWSYGRLDLLAASEEQVNLMGEIGWTAVTFGVETLNRQSGRAVGKGADPEKLKKCLLRIKQQYPNLHIQINLIVGLPHSTKEDIKESVDWLLENSIADRLKVWPLSIIDPSGKSFSSSMAKNPEKYGYKILNSIKGHYIWSNDSWTLESALQYVNELETYIKSKKSKNTSYNNIMTNYPVEDYILEKTKFLTNLN